MKIPKTWKKVESRDPKWFEFEVPCGERLSQELTERVGAAFIARGGDIAMTCKGRRYERFGTTGNWVSIRKVRNPDYVEPDHIVMIYALRGVPNNTGFVLCRFPPGLKWVKEVIPALNRVARIYRSSFYAKGDDRALLEGAEQEAWDSKRFVRYEWDGKRDFKPVE